MIKTGGYTLKETVILLQHTRIVPRKKIEVAIDLAFKLSERFARDGQRKCIALLISGHSGDEQVKYKEYLEEYFQIKSLSVSDHKVFMIFGENHILSHRDIIVDKKYYNFFEIPGIVASLGGIGTYFSETEGFGNNLLEMIAAGLPVVINKYDIYKTDVEPLGFNMPFIEKGVLDDALIEKTFKLTTDITYRNQVVSHNLSILSEKLGHKVISRLLSPLINNIFTKSLF
jgi:glycosyltransferase involved in cell wall biosynthesis